ncbi:hypothetical protein DDE18_14210 [Nocardioides gansuensis]|uniref:RNA polymerase subunit sigma-70 n=1 Tax=Nocardioides gansuensis TaxID=2138300 RepID=A0A2T8F823_9ACTN|nr:SatD family protein [Nocardioides gansuensis]PVG81871.1 hypothetical protein DDE18_14210 [Nocardioides gansuensis]
MASATLIGDLVGSRSVVDRQRLHGSLQGILDEVNARARPRSPLRITVGDEFQGAFASVGQAVAAALRIRLALAPAYDVRHGVGWGEVTVLVDEPRVEDGPGWWIARKAVEAVEEAERRPATRSRRTAYRAVEGAGGPDEAAVDAALMLRDALLDGLSERSLSVLRGLLAGSTQREIADELGISASAVSQRVRADHLGALVAAERRLEELG